MVNMFRTSLLGIMSAGALMGLGGCTDEVLTTLKNADVDGSKASPEQALAADKARVDTLITTAQDMVVGKGGVVESVMASNPKLTIAIVDPLTLGRPEDDRPLLDTRPGAHAFLSGDELAAQKALPDLPIGEGTPAASKLSASPATVQAVAMKDEPVTGRMIQVGSFSTRQGAEAAWSKVAGMYDGMDRLSPIYESVTANGRTLVRLRIGPVQDEGQARALCSALGVTDNWCTKAG